MNINEFPQQVNQVISIAETILQSKQFVHGFQIPKGQLMLRLKNL